MSSPIPLTFTPIQNTLGLDLVPGTGDLLMVADRAVYHVSLVEQEDGSIELVKRMFTMLPEKIKTVMHVHRWGRMLFVFGKLCSFVLNTHMKEWRPYCTERNPTVLSHTYSLEHQGNLVFMGGLSPAGETMSTGRFLSIDDQKMNAMYCGLKPMSHGVQAKLSGDIVAVGDELHLMRTDVFWNKMEHYSFVPSQAAQKIVKPKNTPEKWVPPPLRAASTTPSLTQTSSLANGKWKPCTEVPFEAYNPAVLSVGDNMVVIGGRYHEDQIHTYSTATGTWASWGTLPFALDRGVATMISTDTALVYGYSRSTSDDPQ
ncbi:hypothetical protein KIPB_006203, partial [Kipferlia bialata]|eukprot:g6203.t1